MPKKTKKTTANLLLIPASQSKVAGNFGFGERPDFVPVKITGEPELVEIEGTDRTFSRFKAEVDGEERTITTFEIFGAKVDIDGKDVNLGDAIQALLDESDEQLTVPAEFEIKSIPATDKDGKVITRAGRSGREYTVYNVWIQGIEPEDFIMD